MFEISRVINARREQHHIGVGLVMWRNRVQGIKQFLWVMVDSPHPVTCKHTSKSALHGLAILKHIAHAAWHTQIVFQHVIFTIRATNEVTAADMNVDICRDIHAAKLWPVMFRLLDVEARNHLVFENLLVVIDVMQE